MVGECLFTSILFDNTQRKVILLCLILVDRVQAIDTISQPVGLVRSYCTLVK
uniref:Uncharacterized protein n=1 Tax=Arundo donax TaxID=35708 RepID=A0A0A9HVK0_ARUDO